MKKFTKILTLAMSMVLSVSLLAACTGGKEDATTGTQKPGTSTTTKATTPSTTKTPKATGVIPDATDLRPDATNGTILPRGQRGPRY